MNPLPSTNFLIFDYKTFARKQKFSDFIYIYFVIKPIKTIGHHLNYMLQISHPTNPSTQMFIEANKHFIKTILDANRLFIPKGSHNSINHTHLFMHIYKLFYHHNHIHKQNRPDPQIITL